MKRKPNPPCNVMKLIASVLPFVVCFQFISMNTMAQTTTNSKGFLASRVSTRASDVKVAFTYGPKYPKEGQTVQFVDASTGSPISWDWDFGDGSTSADQNPSHIFSSPGFRKVTLIVTNNAGSRKAVKSIMIIPDAAASIVFSPTTPGPGQNVQFADTSSGNPTSWQWDFGDGGASTSKNPSHVFMKEASYTVTLISSNSSGSKQGYKTKTVTVAAALAASFSYSPASPAARQVVQFTDTSAGAPISWQWNFGDGGTSTSQNPSHSYTTSGSKTVSLTATNASGSNSTTKTVTVAAALAASFSFSPASPAAGQAVQFTDTSAGTPTSWQWNFGDGVTSTAQNPSYSYATAGSKTVSLTATNASGASSTTKTVTVAAALAASFSYSPASPAAGQAVQFTDTSVGVPTSWQWNFGDGVTSTSQNPSHSYATAGSKTVTLTVTNSSGSNSTTKTVTVAAGLTASFSFSPASPAAGQVVQFTDTSAGTPTSWQWNFGDGVTSTSQNPSYSYATAGSKTVTLTVTNNSGSNSTTKTVTVVAVLAASFSFNSGSPVPGQVVQFTDTSVGSPTSWHWDFNDASTSGVQNPSHAFSNSGSYNVTLVVSNAYGSNSISENVIVGSGEGSIGTYWVSPTGTASWANAKSATPLSGAACCSLSTANANASAGDTITLRGGTYSMNISPARSGTVGNRITFEAYAGETPTITVDEAGGRQAIKLIGKQYIKIDGITSSRSLAFFFIGYGSCYNEIVNCTFDRSSFIYSLGLIGNVDTAFNKGAGSNHNWIHNCTFSRYGSISAGDDIGTVRISAALDDPSSNNTFEDCVFFYGGHDNLDIGGRYNVVRNNVFHNEEAYYADTTGTSANSPVSGYFGNRNILLTNYGDGVGTARYTLIESNRIGYAGTPPDDDGAMGIENAGVQTLTRYNYIYGSAADGYYSKAQPVPSPGVFLKSGSYARVYNNTIYHSGFGDPDISAGFKWGIDVVGISLPEYFPWPLNLAFKNNIVYDSFSGEFAYTPSAEGQITYENNFNTNPSFTNPNMSDKTSLTLPDLSLQAGSLCINAGTNLTKANGSGSNSTTLAVGDSLYFQDGTWGSALTHGVTHFPDWIAIGTVTNIVQIAAINYAANTITLASPMTWTDNAKIWLFSDSGGRCVLKGTAPDMGAHEYGQR
jgi:PKD repeat protein